MIEIEEAGADMLRLINIEAIQEVLPAGTERSLVRMRDGSEYYAKLSYDTFRARLSLLLNRMLPLEATL